ncbi:MAG: hypothetical protein ACKOYO_01630, partial [Actinomycetota bacterium]
MKIAFSTFTRRVTSLLATAAAVVTGACTADDDRTSSPTTLTLVAYESFVLPEDAFAEFTAATGISVEIALGGDAGEVVAKAVLTAGNPEGDVLWGVDTTLLSRAIGGDVFNPYVAAEPAIPQRLRAAGVDVVTPVDVGHVCINYDIGDLQSRDLQPPATLTISSIPAIAVSWWCRIRRCPRRDWPSCW